VPVAQEVPVAQGVLDFSSFCLPFLISSYQSFIYSLYSLYHMKHGRFFKSHLMS